MDCLIIIMITIIIIIIIIIAILLGSLKFFTKPLHDHDNYLQHKTIYSSNCIKIVKKSRQNVVYKNKYNDK